MDYLARDAHFAGVKYGSFDLDQVIHACRKHQSGNETYLVIDEEGLYAVEQLVVAKYHMTQQVYAHRVRTVTDLMIVRGLELAIEDGVAEIARLYKYDGSLGFLERYLQYDDGQLITFMLGERRSKNVRGRSIFRRLHRRDLFKELAVISLAQGRDVKDDIVRDRLQELGKETTKQLEQIIAKELKCEAWEIIVHKKSVKNPVYQAPGALDPNTIYVNMRDGNTVQMSSIPDLLSAKMPADDRLHVIGPHELPDHFDREQRRQRQKEIGQNILDMIISSVT